MNIPKLKKIKSEKKYHDITLNDDYAWVDQSDILDVLRDAKKINPEVKDYINSNNKVTEKYFSDVVDLQKDLFKEIKSKIKLDDVSLKFKDKKYFYWTKTEAESNYGKRIRQLIDKSKPEEVFFDADYEKKQYGSEYFGIGSVSVSHCDNFLAYSLDLKGSEYYTIYLRNLRTNKNDKDIIENTSGNITWSIDSKSFFYSKLDKYHRPKQIFKHKLGTPVEDDELIFDEKDETFTCSISLSSDEKFFIISTSDHITTEEYFFRSNEKQITPKLFRERKKDVRYSIDSWRGYFYVHTNEEARDYKILRCKTEEIKKLEVFIPPKKETVIGDLGFLDEYIVRGEKSDAISKLFVRNIKTNQEEEIKISNEAIGVPSFSFKQRDTDTTIIRVGWESMATPKKIYEYDIVSKSKKLVKETEVPSGHDPNKYIIERIKAKSPDGRMIPISLIRLRDSKQNGKSKILLYAYGAYKHSVSPSFSASRFCLIDRGIMFAIAHVRGGGDLGDVWHEEGKKKLKKNTFLDYIACANHLIEQRYTHKGGLCFYGGSAGGLTGGAVANMAPELFFSMLLLVPFVDTMTTMLNEKLPLTPAEWDLWGNPIKSKEYFNYILSYSPYNNLEKKNYPSMLITTSLFDNRVLYSEPVKYIARLRDLKKDENVQLLKCKMEAAGHGGMSGRDNAIKELAEEYSFILKTAKILK
ncbi:MAG: peptidase S9 [Pelagibacteraceae bacterium TMED216]|nr:MAG: peptidase S9 [Pelagibacteraceae bacterium TMED216]|tara:strand:+ start:748 stop:2832 length:2085 start_codon:yes stop_codon:yes gene_type:complete